MTTERDVNRNISIHLLDEAKKLTDSTFKGVKSSRPFLYSHRSAPYWLRSGPRPKEDHSAVASEITNDDEAFIIRLDVSQFNSEEIAVTVVNHRLTISCEHHNEDETKGSTKREYCRSYVLPVAVNTNAITASTSDQGILTIKAPRFCVPTRRRIRDVPIVVSEDYAILENSSEEPIASTSHQKIVEIN